MRVRIGTRVQWRQAWILAHIGDRYRVQYGNGDRATVTASSITAYADPARDPQVVWIDVATKTEI
jgi:hypothetical protein